MEKKQKEIEKLTKERDIYIKVYEAKDTMYTDQTGKFSVISSRGNKYMMVLVDIDSNSIWVEAMKNRTEGEMILARRRALARIKLSEITRKKQVMDNEASALFKQEIIDTGMTYQKVPHRQPPP